MIIEAEIILRLRDKCSVFSNRVGGVRTLEKATQESPNWNSMPQCFVMTIQKSRQSQPQGNSSFQMIQCQFAVIVAISTKDDEKSDKSFDAQISLSSIEDSLCNALMGWTPISAQSSQYFTNVEFDKAFFLSAENGILWWEFDWVYSYYKDSIHQNESSMANIPQDVIDALYPDKDNYVMQQPVVPNNNFPVNIKQLIMEHYNLNDSQYNEVLSHAAFIW